MHIDCINDHREVRRAANQRPAVKKPPAGGFSTNGVDADRAETQTVKLDPQPQVVVAFGLRMTNCAPSRSSL